MASGHAVADFTDNHPSQLICERQSCPSPQLPAGSKRHPVSNPQGTQVRWYCAPCYERTIELPTTYVASHGNHVRQSDDTAARFPQVNVERIHQQTNTAQRNLGQSRVQAMGRVRASPDAELGQIITVPRLQPAVGYNVNHLRYEHQRAVSGRTKNKLVENIRLGLAGIPACIGAMDLKQRDLDAANANTDAVYRYFIHPGKKPGEVIFKPRKLKVELVISARQWDKIQEHLANWEAMGGTSPGTGGNPGSVLGPPAVIVGPDTWSPPSLSQILRNVGKPPSPDQQLWGYGREGSVEFLES
ncbi:hypothetical protein JB92DRAFT_3106423 [Gautieria morchelliformis]|nr:hypothetical protein JB92DRAFT_3106423 [Gautieria morchelliformis]